MRFLTVVLAACGLMMAAEASYAQRDAGSKMSGQAYEIGSAGLYQQHAYENAQAVQYYAEQGKAVPKETMTEHASQVRHNIALSSKRLASLESLAKTDKTVAMHLKTIKDENAKAVEACRMLDESAELGTKSATISKCCIDMAAHLKAAKAEHEKLEKYLKLTPIVKK